MNTAIITISNRITPMLLLDKLLNGPIKTLLNSLLIKITTQKKNCYLKIFKTKIKLMKEEITNLKNSKNL